MSRRLSIEGRRRVRCLDLPAPAAWLTVLAWALVIAPAASAEGRPPLRVCADPNNLPFSNRAEQGFENRLAALLAADQGLALEYTWWPQRRGFTRSTVDAGRCDVVIGVPRGDPRLSTTRAYYRSAYVFVSRRDRHLAIDSLDDQRLRRLRIGVPLVGDEFANSPPALALSARGMTTNVVGYPVLGDYSTPSPPSRILTAVADGEVDAALVWGPLAGYFAQRSPVPLTLASVMAADSPSLPFAFDIAMGVRRDDEDRRRTLDGFIVRQRPAIDAILREFGVPRVDITGGAAGGKRGER